MNVPSVSKAERRRLVEANLAASRFFRSELLRADCSWAARYLVARGARRVLTPESRWALGYAPDSWARLVDHLRSRGFEFQTLELAGLAMRTAEGQIVDRFRDQLMLMSRDERLDPVGFVGFREGSRPFYTMTAVTPVHHRSKVLLGVDEQLPGSGSGPHGSTRLRSRSTHAIRRQSSASLASIRCSTGWCFSPCSRCLCSVWSSQADSGRAGQRA
ncbi:hypothetical protein [Kribbella sp. VKM Ac-2541]|uniref:hypothetical protein n=1 Tax=Kribbella antiqua TaxID=2512217 RepID=UPI0013052014